MRAKPDLLFPPDPSRPAPGRSVWLVELLAVLYLTGIVVTDFLLPARYGLIEFYGIAPLIAASTVGWRLTASTGLLAVLAGLLDGEWDGGGIDRAAVLLPVGCVAASALAAMIVAAIRERREGRLAAMTEVAEVAEHAIVRSAPISLPDLEVALVYRSASNLASVGGDLYEAVSTPYGSRLIIGDAKGKGLPAVQLAAVVLGAFRHAALSEPDLVQLVTDLDRTVAAFATEEDFVTALIVEVDDLDIRLVGCGHPWPLVGPPGYVRPITLEGGLPLGLGGPRQAEVRGFPTRQVLIAYTDGLAESRDSEGRMLDIRALAASIDTWEPEEAIKEVERAFSDHVAGRVQDDVTVLAFKRTSE